MISGGRVDNGLGDKTALTANHSFSELETNADGDSILPAGDYHRYVITDSTPSSVTLLLNGPTGTRRLAPAVPVASSVAQPELRLSPQGVTTGGALGELRGEGLLLQPEVVLNSATSPNSSPPVSIAARRR